MRNQPSEHRPPISPARPGFGNVVVGIDFSPHGQRALERATKIPLHPGGVLDIVHALDGQGLTSAQVDEAHAQDLVQAARDQAERSLASTGTHHVTASVVPGAPFKVIADRAHHGRAELAVIGRRFERRPVVGSTAERLVRHGSVPVLAVANRPYAPYRHPLVAVDIAESSQVELEMAARMCDPTVDVIDVLYVLPFRPHWGSARYEQRARETLEAFVSTVDVGVHWNVIVKFGEPRSTILDEADARAADLIALGTKGRRGLSHVLLGSLAQGVLRDAVCDVLIAQLPEVGR